ncbi:MAG TPA: DUF1648 domain-containing protein [Terriglobales bacterium]|nr:DUF1648 domain-containing protein [Terriglobales bacterium]
MKEATRLRLERLLIALPWAAIPVLAIHLASVWGDLPQRIAVHFDLSGRPNGWQSPQTFAIFTAILLVVVLGTTSFAMLRAFRQQSFMSVVTLVQYSTAGVMFTVSWQVLDHAAYGRPMASVWTVPAIFPFIALLFACVVLAFMRPSSTVPSPNASLIAEERHSQPLQLLFLLPGLLVGLWIAIKLAAPVRLIGVLLIALMAWVAVGVIQGFQYLVRTDGVLIKGFLLPLHFIPVGSIRGYHADRWTGLGYGVRLTSTGTAYIWGGRDIVSISTDSGSVMLGYENPQRLIQDLDRMMQAGR